MQIGTIMERILDKLILLICCSFTLYMNEFSLFSSVFLVIAILGAAITIVFTSPAFKIFIFIAYCIAATFFPLMLYFIPLISYELLIEPFKYVTIISVFIFILNYDYIFLSMIFWTFLNFFLTYMLKLRTTKLEQSKLDYLSLRDIAIEDKITLDLKNKELLEKQDYEITNATLNERNRIAREIHDSVGHLLSSSILQIGALLAITKDDFMKENLENIKNTLSTGMDSIRSSIHNIHEDSVDLSGKLEELISNFTFCKVDYKYNITTDFSIKAKYTIIFIMKEALNNIIKHSNATEVKIKIIELPALYQIVVHDNGTHPIRKNTGSGMGTISINERVTSLDGNINISYDHGYRLFISLPKSTTARTSK